MQRCWRRLILPGLFFCCSFALEAQQYLFVFHEGAQASVYDPATLELVGTPTVGAGAVRAIGVPDQATPSNLSKIYVVRDDAVVVLDPLPPFATRATLELRGPLNAAERGAVLTPDGKRLVVIAGRFAQIFDATDPANPLSTSIDFSREPTGVTVLPDSEHAYVSVTDSVNLEIISLTSNPPVRLAGPIPLPQPATAVAATPNASAVYAAATGAFYEIDPIANSLTREILGTTGSPAAIGFDPDAPVDVAFVRHGATLTTFDLVRRLPDVQFFGVSALSKAVSAGKNLVYFLSTATGQIYQGNFDTGVFGQLANPETAAPFDLPGVDLEVDSANQNLFLALGGLRGAVVSLDAQALLLRHRIVPPAPPTHLSAVASPGNIASGLEVYGGNHQVAPVGHVLPKPLVVRALASNLRPAAKQTVQFTTQTANVVFRPPNPVTNNDGVAQTIVTVPITDPFTIQARILPGNLTTTFDINSALAEEEGLSIVSGDYQITNGGADFPRPFRVRAVSAAIAIPNLVLTITTSNFAGTCPAMVTTGTDGEASFTCTSAAVVGPTATTIQVSDTFGRTLPVPFQARVVVNEDKLPRDARLTSATPVVGQVNTRVQDAIVIRAIERISGLPVPNVGVEFTVPGDVTVDPAIAVTDQNGNARAAITFGCKLETNTITATLNSPGLPTAMISHGSLRGAAARLVRLQGNNQSGGPGQVLPLALLARATDDCGNPAPGTPLTWDVSPIGAATLENAFSQSNNAGEASTRVRLGNSPGPLTVRVSAAGAAVGFSLTVVATANQVAVISGDSQSIPAGQLATQALVIEVQDSAGTPLGGTAVNFRVTQGAGALGTSSATTDASGRASTTVTAGSQVGPLRVEARSGDSVFVFTLNVIGRTPAVTQAGFVNGASFTAGWTPGSTGSIFGVGLMEGVDGVVAAPAPFPTTLRGVQVLVENTPAPILSIANVNGQEQINIQVPFGIPAPSEGVVVTIINNGASASFSNVRTFARQPGIFEVILPGGRFAAALHADYSLVEPNNPARPGEILLLFWTGGGSTNPAVATNQPGPVPPAEVAADVAIVASGVNAEVLGSFYAPTLVTVYQTNFRVPAGLTTGTLVVQLISGGAQSQQVVIPLQP